MPADHTKRRSTMRIPKPLMVLSMAMLSLVVAVGCFAQVY
jgi:hypothetical protein